MPYRIRLRTAVFLEAAQRTGFPSEYALAVAMGVNRSTVSRVVTGELHPGGTFIAGALTALAPLDFDALFELLPAGDLPPKGSHLSTARAATARLRDELVDARREPGADAWFDEHRHRILPTLRAVTGEPDAAAALLIEVWSAVPSDVDETWVQQLSDIGAELAAVLPTSLLLARAFRSAARSLRAQNRPRLAATEGMRELAIHRLRDDDPDATVDALQDLAETYRLQGRLHKVIGCADEALETHFRHWNQPGIARTLAYLGSLMIEAGRYDSAVTYLNRADQTYEHTPDADGRAECLARLGQALWLSGDQSTAEHVFTRALALVTGIDDEIDQHVRSLITDTRQLGVGSGRERSGRPW